MLATACDRAVMVKENARIGLNEVGFGSSLFAGSVELLRFWVGDRGAGDRLRRGAVRRRAGALAGAGRCDSHRGDSL
jgi:enoyl-CoA hydratase/carnithine racemase